MARKRKHHYVQARYLDGFITEPHGMLMCYGRKRAAPYSAVPDNLAHQRDYYDLPDARNGENLEDFLEKNVETPGLAALRALVTTKRPLEWADRIRLAKYIAFQETRVPYMRDRVKMQMLHEARSMVEQFQETGGTKAEHFVFATVKGEPVMRSSPVVITRAEAEEHLRELESNPLTFDLEMMVDMANDVTTFLAQMRWKVLFAPCGSAFVTSDCPVFRMFTDESDPDEAFLRPDCRVICPLTRSALLVMEHDMEFLNSVVFGRGPDRSQIVPSTYFVDVSDPDVLAYNRAIVENCNLWCFVGSKQDWIPDLMKGRSKRAELHLFAQKNLTGGRWIRPVSAGETGKG